MDSHISEVHLEKDTSYYGEKIHLIDIRENNFFIDC